MAFFSAASGWEMAIKAKPGSRLSFAGGVFPSSPQCQINQLAKRWDQSAFYRAKEKIALQIGIYVCKIPYKGGFQ